MAKATYSGSDKVRDVILTKMDGDLEELFASVTSLSASGIAYDVSAKTTSATVAVTDTAGHVIITNTGASGTVTMTLRAGIANNRIAFYVDAAYTLKVAAATGEKIRYLANLGSASGYVQSSTEGDFIELTWNGTEWAVTSIEGFGWTDGTITLNRDVSDYVLKTRFLL